MNELLKTEHLSVSFFTDAGEVEAVRDVSFTVEKGEVLAIVGESGKSSLLTAENRYLILIILRLNTHRNRSKQKTKGQKICGYLIHFFHR